MGSVFFPLSSNVLFLIAGVDFWNNSFTITVPALTTSVSITNITIVNDNVTENEESFILVARILGQAANVACFQLDEISPCNSEGQIGGTQLRIRDDEGKYCIIHSPLHMTFEYYITFTAPFFGFAERFFSVTENVIRVRSMLHSRQESVNECDFKISIIDGTATVIEAPTLERAWDVTFAHGVDFGQDFSSISITRNQTEAYVDMIIKNDIISEGNETLTLTVTSGRFGGDRCFFVCYDDGETPEEGKYFCSQTITIVDDDGQFQNFLQYALY